MNLTSTSSYGPGDIVLVEVPYTDLTGSKKRPAVVLLSRGWDYLVAFLTSRLEQARADDVVVAATPETGLAVDSAVLVTKLFTLHESLIARGLGRVSATQHQLLIGHLTDLLRATLST